MEPSSLSRRFARHVGAVAVVAIASCIPLVAVADTVLTPHVSGVMVAHGWSRPTPPGATVGVGYMVIHNHTDAAIRFTGASTEVARQVSIHETRADNGMMSMKPLPDGLNINPGQSVEFKPLSYHLMLEGLKQPLKVGQEIPVTLTFERIPVQHTVLKVRSLDAADINDGEMNHSDMNHADMDH